MTDNKKRKLGGGDNNNGDEEIYIGSKGRSMTESRRTELASRFLIPMNQEQLVQALSKIIAKVPDAYDILEEAISTDSVHRRLFVRGLGNEVKSKQLADAAHAFGETEEPPAVIKDKASGNSKGYGFVVFKTLDATIDALDKGAFDIDGKSCPCNLAHLHSKATQQQPQQQPQQHQHQHQQQQQLPYHQQSLMASHGQKIEEDIDSRKIFIRNLLDTTTAETVRSYMSSYGEVEDASIVIDKHSGKSKCFGFIIFRTAAAAAYALQNPVKEIDGRPAQINLAINGKFLDQQQKGQQQQQQNQQLQYQMAPLLGYSAPQPVMNGGMGVMKKNMAISQPTNPIPPQYVGGMMMPGSAGNMNIYGGLPQGGMTMGIGMSGQGNNSMMPMTMPMMGQPQQMYMQMPGMMPPQPNNNMGGRR